MKFKIDSFKVEYLESIHELYKEIDNLHHESIPSIYKKSYNRADINSHIQKINNDDNQKIVVAIDENCLVVGFGEYNIKEVKDNKVFEDRRYVNISCIVVRDGFKRKGIGRLLLDYIENESKANGINSIELMVWGFNIDAITFYEINGYGLQFKKLQKKLN